MAMRVYGVSCTFQHWIAIRTTEVNQPDTVVLSRTKVRSKTRRVLMLQTQPPVQVFEQIIIKHKPDSMVNGILTAFEPSLINEEPPSVLQPSSPRTK
jgi:hypothetical protein